MSEIENERLLMLGRPDIKKDENDEEEIEARLTKMLGGGDNQPLLSDGAATNLLMKHRMAQPQYSIMKARSNTGNNITMQSSRSMINRFDRKGRLIDESSVKNYEVTFADNIQEVKKLTDVIVVESYKEHNYDNTHEP